MEEAGESRGERLGEGVILTRCGTVRRLCPHPLLHYCNYVPLNCALGSISGAKPCVTFQLRRKEKGQGNDVGTTCQRQQPNCGAFSIPLIVLLLHGRGAIFNLQPSLPPSTSILFTTSSLSNFNPPCQLHPLSLPTSTLVVFQFLNPNHCAMSSPSS
jgi:hypothetical protein